MKYLILLVFCTVIKVNASSPPALAASALAPLSERIEYAFLPNKKTEQPCCEQPKSNQRVTCILTKATKDPLNTRILIDLCSCTTHDTQYLISLVQYGSPEIVASRKRIVKNAQASSPIFVTPEIENIFADIYSRTQKKASELYTTAKTRTFTLNNHTVEEQ
jgi:hypothetical protein